MPRGSYLAAAAVVPTYSRCHVRLYNSTDAADVANTETMGAYTETTGKGFVTTPHLTAVVTVTGAKTIKLYAKRDGGSPTFTTSSLYSDSSSGRTRLGYLKVSN